VVVRSLHDCGADLSKSDTGRSDNAHKRDNGASSQGVRSKQDYSRMLRNRVALEIS
jgi:hypothetical protein